MERERKIQRERDDMTYNNTTRCVMESAVWVLSVDLKEYYLFWARAAEIWIKRYWNGQKELTVIELWC